MQQGKRTYETVFIVNPTLDDPQIDAIVEKVKDFIVKQGGEIVDLNKWGRKRLAYAIQKKNNGFYVVIEFRAPADAIGKLERFYFLEENIIRYLTVYLDKKALAKRAAAAARLASEAAASAASAKPQGTEDIIASS
ncbi:MAG TPA: 30S ribosomal protein S6 [Bacteroidota bacterium]|nr:30S ribosomal protein S6 [Bacteroidota bacterium]